MRNFCSKLNSPPSFYSFPHTWEYHAPLQIVLVTELSSAERGRGSSGRNIHFWSCPCSSKQCRTCRCLTGKQLCGRAAAKEGMQARNYGCTLPGSTSVLNLVVFPSQSQRPAAQQRCSTWRTSVAPDPHPATAPLPRSHACPGFISLGSRHRWSRTDGNC